MTDTLTYEQLAARVAAAGDGKVRIRRVTSYDVQTGVLDLADGSEADLKFRKDGRKHKCLPLDRYEMENVENGLVEYQLKAESGRYESGTVTVSDADADTGTFADNAAKAARKMETERLRRALAGTNLFADERAAYEAEVHRRENITVEDIQALPKGEWVWMRRIEVRKATDGGWGHGGKTYLPPAYEVRYPPVYEGDYDRVAVTARLGKTIEYDKMLDELATEREQREAQS